MTTHPLTTSPWTKFALALLLAALVLLPARPAQAHGYIVRSIPEDRAVLERAPTRVQYWFSEDLEPAFSRVDLLDATGAVIASGGVDDEDNSLMVLRPPANLPDGAYVVALRPAFASDGHVVAETRVFFVGDAVAGIEGDAASDAAVPLEVVWRGVVLAATTLLFGVFVLYDQVLLPAWGNPKHIAGFLPPRVMTQLTWIAGAALAVAIAGNVLALLQNAMVLFDAPLGRVLHSNLWNTARIGSRFGEVWNVRMLLLLLLAALMALTVVWRKDKPRTVAPFWRTLMWGTALVVGSFAVSSHAAGSLVMPWTAMFIHWLHMTAVAVWTGGLAALVLVLPAALRPYEGEQRRLALLAVMRRFSRVALGAAVVTLTTGVYNSLNWLFTPSDVGTSYAVSLIYKLLLVGGLLLVGAVHHVALNPERYARASRLVERVGGWRVTLPLEVVAAFAVLIAAGRVSATPPPTPDFVNSDVPTPTAAQTVNDLTAQMTLSPGGLGVNTYDVRLLDADAPAQAVYVQLVRPSADRRGVWHEAEPVEAGLYVAAGDELDEEGVWLSLVDVHHSDGSFTRYAYPWEITNDATVIESVAPGWQHWAALAAVLVALGWVLTPAYRAFVSVMNFNTLTVTIVLLSVGVTGLVSWGAFAYLGAVQQQTALLSNPPPQRINPVLPDELSVRAGAQLYAAACAWDDERLLAALVERLPRTRDEELFTFTVEGWRSLPACANLLSDEDRWHIVNHLRTLEIR